MSDLKAIVFDLDDTLYPERAYVESGFAAVAAWVETNLEIPAASVFGELLDLFHRGVRGNTFGQWLQSRDLDDARLERPMVAAYRSHVPVIQPFPGVRETLDDLQNDFKLALVTDGYLNVQKRKLEALRLASFFEALVFSDELGRVHWKPSVVPFESALDQLDVAARQAAYVGDNVSKDFLGARALGMVTVQIKRPRGEYADLSAPSADHEPHLVLLRLDDLGSALKAWSVD